MSSLSEEGPKLQTLQTLADLFLSFRNRPIPKTKIEGLHRSARSALRLLVVSGRFDGPNGLHRSALTGPPVG